MALLSHYATQVRRKPGPAVWAGQGASREPMSVKGVLR